jgi:hypothetical protein
VSPLAHTYIPRPCFWLLLKDPSYLSPFAYVILRGKQKWSVRQRLNTCMRPLYLPSLSMLLITTKITFESNPPCCSEVAESPLLVSAKCTLVARTSIRRRCENSINPDTVLKAPYKIHQVKDIIQCIYDYLNTKCPAPLTHSPS